MADNEERDPVAKYASPVTELVKAVPIYQDLAQPAAREVGKALGTVASTVNVALAPLRAFIWTWKQVEGFVEDFVTPKLKDVPPENIQTPNPHVAVPLLQALAYTGDQETLREMYASLLATSMDSRVGAAAHPSFVEIIKSMTPDEAKLLKELTRRTSHALLQLRAVLSNNGGFVVLQDNVSFLGQEACCSHPDLVPSSLENLQRLGLARILWGTSVTDNAQYQRLLKSVDTVKYATLAKSTNGGELQAQTGLIQLTAFGNHFVGVCVH